MSNISLSNIDESIKKIQSNIEEMNSNKDITTNVDKYNLNVEKIRECKTIINKVLEDINELEECMDTESTDELLDDKEFVDYLNDLEEIRKKFNGNTINKLNELLDLYKLSVNKTNKCKEYLENQKIEISNLE